MYYISLCFISRWQYLIVKKYYRPDHSVGYTHKWAAVWGGGGGVNEGAVLGGGDCSRGSRGGN